MIFFLVNFFLVNYYLVTFGIVRQTDRRTDGKRRIRAHRALAQRGSKMKQRFPQVFKHGKTILEPNQCTKLTWRINFPYFEKYRNQQQGLILDK